MFRYKERSGTRSVQDAKGNTKWEMKIKEMKGTTRMQKETQSNGTKNIYSIHVYIYIYIYIYTIDMISYALIISIELGKKCTLKLGGKSSLEKQSKALHDRKCFYGRDLQRPHLAST